MTDDETKAMRDALIFGTGFMQDGKHVPMEAVMTDDLVKRLRVGIHTSVDPLALTNEAADRIEQLDRLVVITGKINVQLMECAMEQKSRIEQLEAMLETVMRSAGYPDHVIRAALGEKKDG